MRKVADMFNSNARRTRRTRKLIFTRYDYISKSVHKTLEKYSIKRIPVETFNSILSSAKFNSQEMYEHAESLSECLRFNHALQLMSVHAVAQGRKSIFKHTITKDVVDEWISALKAGYLKAIEDEKRKN